MQTVQLPVKGFDTPATPEYLEAMRLYDEHMAEYRTRNADLLADTEFAQGLADACAADKRLTLDHLRIYAGSMHGDEREVCNTVALTVKWYCQDNGFAGIHAETGTQAAAKRQQERSLRQQIDTAYRLEYNEYLDACRERNARHARARTEHAERIAESKRILDMETSDPAPCPPVKRQA